MRMNALGTWGNRWQVQILIGECVKIETLLLFEIHHQAKFLTTMISLRAWQRSWKKTHTSNACVHACMVCKQILSKTFMSNLFEPLQLHFNLLLVDEMRFKAVVLLRAEEKGFSGYYTTCNMTDSAVKLKRLHTAQAQCSAPFSCLP